MTSYNAKWPGQSFIFFLAWAYLAFVMYGSWVPFNFHPELAAERYLLFTDPAQFSWRVQSKADVFTNVLLTMPLVFLWSALATAGGRSNQIFGPLFVLIGSVFVSALVEWAQIYFLPRDPSLADITAQLFGSSLSVLIWWLWGKKFIESLATIPLLKITPSISLRLLILYLIGVFAYGLVPLDLTLSISEFYRKFRDGRALLIPFWRWHYNHPELFYGFLGDIALWIPVGILGWFAIPKPKKTILWYAMIAAALLEFMQLFVLSRVSDSTQIIAAAIGTFIGLIIAQICLPKRSVVQFPISSETGAYVNKTRPEIIPPKTPNKDWRFVWMSVAILFVGTILWFITKLPQVPYNVRALPYAGHPYLSMILIAAALVWTMGFPFWIARKFATNKKSTLYFPFWLLLYGSLAWCFTFFGVEPIRAYKIIGSPILNWPGHTEWILRFLALMASIGLFAVLGCILGGQKRYLGLRLGIWLLHSIWLLPLLYWAIITEAATDNLVELLAWNASPISALLFFLVVSNICFAASLTQRVFESNNIFARLTTIFGICISFPLGFWLLQTATEPVIIKYEKVFSGIQFILSADRTQYAQTGSLIIRYFVLHLFLIIVSAASRWLFLNKSYEANKPLDK